MIGNARRPAARRSRNRHRLVAALGAAVLAFGGGIALALPAHAAAVDFPTHCVPPPISGVPPIDGTSNAAITVDNLTPKVGDTVHVTYKVNQAAAGNPTDIALPADVVTPTGKVTLGGAQTGSINVAGPKSNPPVPGRAPFPPFSMPGSFTVTAPGAITLSPGDYNIHTSFVLELDTPCTVISPPAPVSETVTATDSTPVNERSILLGATSGPPGAAVTVTGAKFTAGATVTVAGRAGDTQTGDRTTVTADSQGAFAASLKVNDKATTGIVAYEGASWNPDKGAGPRPYTVDDDTPVPPGSQKLSATVKGGTLSMTQAGDTVQMSPVTFGEGGSSTGRLQTVTVKDFRGGTVGWSLTGKVTDFKGPGSAVIGADKLSWSPSCATKAGSPSTCAAGSPGTVGSSGATLASAPNGTPTGGEFTADAGLTLNVPSFAATGNYSGVLTLTLT